jgi:glutamate/tyrosine decarboxylase-like PLP-dependent enzyme
MATDETMLDRAALARAHEVAEQYLGSLPGRPVAATASLEELRHALARGLTDEGIAPVTVLSELAAAVDAGLNASGGPRWYGFVDGGSLPVALAADWLTSAWDQNAGLMASSPAAAVTEEVVADWVLDLLRLPAAASVGFVSGGQMANFTGLAAARHALLRRLNWDVAAGGLWGAPRFNVLVGANAHVSLYAALRMLGLGTGCAQSIETDDQGRMRVDDLRRRLASCDGPTLVCALAGNVNTGAFDPLDAIADAAQEHGDTWLHVDGAFGLWAAASPARRHLVEGADRADSWCVDGHKWLNVPYDSGIAVVRDADAHRAAMTLRADYLVRAAADGSGRDPTDFVPEGSRRARAFVLYATLRSLGRSGTADVIDRCCHHARRFAGRLDAEPGLTVLNDVVLNQVLVGVTAATPEQADERTDAVIGRVQREGTCWLAGTTWRDRRAMRISVVNWSTTEEDVDRSAAAIIAAVRAEEAQASA